MPVKFGGQESPAQCPVCDSELDWSRAGRRPDERVTATANQHLPDCDAAVVDPARLRRATREEALALAAATRSS